RDAILGGIDGLQEALARMRSMVAGGDRDGLLEQLEAARAARINLPTRAPRPEELSELRVPVPDRVGVLADVTTLVRELGVNMYDFGDVPLVGGGRGGSRRLGR